MSRANTFVLLYRAHYNIALHDTLRRFKKRNRQNRIETAIASSDTFFFVLIKKI